MMLKLQYDFTQYFLYSLVTSFLKKGTYKFPKYPDQLN